MDEEGILIFAHDACVVVRFILRHVNENRIGLLQLSCSTSGFLHLTYNWLERHWLRSRRSYDNRFLRSDNLCRTTRKIIDNIYGSLWHTKEFLLTTKFLTAVYTFITVILGISYGSTYHCLDIPIASQWP